MCMHVHTYTRVPFSRDEGVCRLPCIRICIRVVMYTYIYVYTYVYNIHTYICIYVRHTHVAAVCGARMCRPACEYVHMCSEDLARELPKVPTPSRSG